MRQYIVDVCVAVKWFVPEIYSEEAARLLNENYSLLAPDYLLPEAGNVFWKKIRFNEISLGEGQQALTAIQNSPMQLVDSKLLLQDAFNLANHSGRSIYDCFYLALAIRENCQMVTSDEKFFNAIKNTVWTTSLCWVEDIPEGIP
ncbi:MAG: type II toxin-antitoxin system VapC family toxin [Chroococcidiopsidaceae cyanobacterium CP_BM_RX_35]|nr:type II toxin-antitoxin system VapC family toxin [Chroococcidiopsidaceae cyanobacterium CP_BM_RX_35]